MKVTSIILAVFLITVFSNVSSAETPSQVKRQMAGYLGVSSDQIEIEPSELSEFYFIEVTGELELTKERRFFFNPQLGLVVLSSGLYKVTDGEVISSANAHEKKIANEKAKERKILLSNMTNMEAIKLAPKNTPFTLRSVNIFFDATNKSEMRKTKYVINELRKNSTEILLFPKGDFTTPRRWCNEIKYAMQSEAIDVATCANRIENNSLITKAQRFEFEFGGAYLLDKDGIKLSLLFSKTYKLEHLIDAIVNNSYKSSVVSIEVEDSSKLSLENEVKRKLTLMYNLSNSQLEQIAISPADKSGKVFYVETSYWEPGVLYFKNESYFAHSQSVVVLPQNKHTHSSTVLRDYNNYLHIKTLSPKIAQHLSNTNDDDWIIYSPLRPQKQTLYLFISWENYFFDDGKNGLDESFYTMPLKTIHELVNKGFVVKVMSPITGKRHIPLINYCVTSSEQRKQFFESLVHTRSKAMANEVKGCQSDFLKQISHMAKTFHIQNFNVIFENGARYSGEINANLIENYYLNSIK